MRPVVRGWLRLLALIEGLIAAAVGAWLLSEFVDANTATGMFVVGRDRYVDG